MALPTCIPRHSCNILYHASSDLADLYVSSNFVQRTLGGGLPTLEGKIHSLTRKLLAPAFSESNIRNMSKDIYAVGDALKAALRAAILVNNGPVVVEIGHYLASATLDVIGKVALNHDFNTLTGGTMGLDLVRLTNEVQSTAMLQAALPARTILRMFPWLVNLPVKVIKSQRAVRDYTKAMAERIVEKGEIDTNDHSLLAYMCEFISYLQRVISEC